MKNELFRTHLFGGYRKEDVDAYIEKLEAEVARLEDGRKDGPAVRQGSALIESAELEDFIFLGGEEETEAVVKTAAEPVAPAHGKMEAEVQAEIEELKQKLEVERAKCDQAARLLQVATYEKQQLTDEVKELREAQRGYEGDREAIKEVLMNARVNAEVIMTKARREARILLEDTHRQINEERRQTMARLMGQVSENCSGLRASKFVLEEQVKSIESMEKQIAELRDRMQGDFETPLNES